MTDGRPGLDGEELLAWRTFLQAGAGLLDRLDEDLRLHCGLSLADYEILAHLSEAPDRTLRMTTLASQVLVSRSGLTRRVDRLAAGGLVERRSCPSDRRGVLAVLTPAGEAALGAAAPVHLAGVRRRFLEPVGSGRAALTGALDAVVRAAVTRPTPQERAGLAASGSTP